MQLLSSVTKLIFANQKIRLGLNIGRCWIFKNRIVSGSQNADTDIHSKFLTWGMRTLRQSIRMNNNDLLEDSTEKQNSFTNHSGLPQWLYRFSAGTQVYTSTVHINVHAVRHVFTVNVSLHTFSAVPLTITHSCTFMLLGRLHVCWGCYSCFQFCFSRTWITLSA